MAVRQGFAILIVVSILTFSVLALFRVQEESVSTAPAPPAGASASRPDAGKCETIEQLPLQKYLLAVYGKCADSVDKRSLRFFYACAPSTFAEDYGVYLPWMHAYAPPPHGTLWPPVWTPACTYILNEVDPLRFWESPGEAGAADGTYAECFHIRDDNTQYAVEGLWLYLGVGSGVRYNVGKSLRAPCKILAFERLGVGPEDTAALIVNMPGTVRAQPDVTRSVSVVDVALRHFRPPAGLESVSAAAWSVARLIETLEQLYSGTYTGALTTSELYDVDRVNNSADYDLFLMPMAKAAGYDSVQFTRQANGNGGWAVEIVLIGESIMYKPVELHWKGWSTIAAMMQTGCGESCTPNYSQSLTMCDEQAIPRSCLGRMGTQAYGDGYTHRVFAHMVWPDGYVNVGPTHRNSSEGIFEPVTARLGSPRAHNLNL